MSLDDHFISLSIKGKAVVDDVMEAQNCLENCISFKVLTPNQLVEATGCMELMGERSKVPDQSLLNLTFHVGWDFFLMLLPKWKVKYVIKAKEKYVENP